MFMVHRENRYSPWFSSSVVLNFLIGLIMAISSSLFENIDIGICPDNNLCGIDCASGVLLLCEDPGKL